MPWRLVLGFVLCGVEPIPNITLLHTAGFSQLGTFLGSSGDTEWFVPAAVSLILLKDGRRVEHPYFIWLITVVFRHSVL